MPLSLHEPRPGKTPNWQIRGTYYGIRVDRTAGTPDKAKARKVLERIKSDIESGAYAPKGALTFAGAALSYARAGKEDRFLEPLSEHFGNTPVMHIDQAAIDEAADTLYPGTSPATRNRQVYTPVSAILKHASVDFEVKRPKGAEGETRNDWLWPEEAFRLLDRAGEIDGELRTFIAILLYTGLRLSDAIWLRIDNLRLSESFAYVPTTKNEDPRPVHLPPALVAELANHPRGLDRKGDTVCRFRKGAGLYKPFNKAKLAAGLPAITPHSLRHTWGTWMRRYAGLDVKGLVATGAWKDEKSAARYAHIVVSEEARRADLLPTPTRKVPKS